MSILQEQAVQMINGLSDDNVSFLIEIIQRIMPQKAYVKTGRAALAGDSMAAFQRLSAARGEIRKYLPEDFDPDRELAEVRAELNFRDSGNFAGEPAERYSLRKPPVEGN